MSDQTNDTDRFIVVCEECGEVTFDGAAVEVFDGRTAAIWYAGYHSGKAHPGSEYQMAFPERYEE